MTNLNSCKNCVKYKVCRRSEYGSVCEEHSVQRVEKEQNCTTCRHSKKPYKHGEICNKNHPTHPQGVCSMYESNVYPCEKCTYRSLHPVYLFGSDCRLDLKFYRCHFADIKCSEVEQCPWPDKRKENEVVVKLEKEYDSTDFSHMKPCPFCGTNTSWYSNGIVIEGHNNNCILRNRSGNIIGFLGCDEIEKWNRRTSK